MELFNREYTWNQPYYYPANINLFKVNNMNLVKEGNYIQS